MAAAAVLGRPARAVVGSPAVECRALTVRFMSERRSVTALEKVG